MGLDIWSYDKDEISDFSKYNYLKNKFDIFITNKDSLQGRHIYQDNINTTQYLRSSYNIYGYNRIATKYGCLTMYDILNPVMNSMNNNNYITKESIYQSLGLSKYNLEKWIMIKYFNSNELILTPKILENSKNSNSNFLNEYIMEYTIGNSYIKLSDIFTRELIDKSISNMNNFKYRKYINKYQTEDNSLKGIIKSNNYIIGLYQDDLDYYVETAETIVKFVEELLQMEEPVLYYWG